MIIHKIRELEDEIKEIIVSSNKYNVTLINVGASIRDIETPDKNGKFESIVLSYKNYKQYLNSESHGALGQTIARHAGRIENSEFILNNKKWKLEPNNGRNNLHSGGNTINKKILPFNVTLDADGKTIISFDAQILSTEDKFPGDISLKIIYIFSDDGFKIEYYATTNADTICNITNHAYFNLIGNFKDTVLEHEIKNTFKSIKHVNDEILVDGETHFENLSTKEWTSIEDIIDNDFFSTGKGFDNPFELESNFIELRSPSSGRKLKVITSYPFTVLYSANYPMNAELLHTKDGIGKIALAIEAQHLPNDININEEMSKTILRKEDKYFEWIEYVF